MKVLYLADRQLTVKFSKVCGTNDTIYPEGRKEGRKKGMREAKGGKERQGKERKGKERERKDGRKDGLPFFQLVNHMNLPSGL